MMTTRTLHTLLALSLAMLGVTAACTPLPDLEDDDDDNGGRSTSVTAGRSGGDGSGLPSDPNACTDARRQEFDRWAVTARVGLVATTAACRSIAIDLGARPSDQQSADGAIDPGAKASAWCQLASAAISAASAAAPGTRVAASVVECGLSTVAWNRCMSDCTRGSCREVTCTGGRLEGICAGTCSPGAATPSIVCGAGGRCEGSCSACDGVDSPPGATCEGTCTGRCAGRCEAGASVSVRCDGVCSGSFEPLACVGGKLEGSCSFGDSASCAPLCDASARASSDCATPAVHVESTSPSLQTTLAVNLPRLLLERARATAAAGTGSGPDAFRSCTSGAGAVPTQDLAVITSSVRNVAAAAGVP